MLENQDKLMRYGHVEKDSLHWKTQPSDWASVPQVHQVGDTRAKVMWDFKQLMANQAEIVMIDKKQLW